MSIVATAPENTPRLLTTYQGAGKLTDVDKRMDTASPAHAPPPLGAAFDDEAEELLPGHGPVDEDGSTWETFQDEGTFPSWL